MKESKTFNRDYGELQKIFTYLKENLAKFGINDDVLFEMELTAEEIFMNMVRHNKSTEEPIKLTLEKKGQNLILSFTDHETDPFDITKADEVDFDEYIKERKSGGLGIHLIRKYMDDVNFKHADGVSTITLTKKI